MKLGGVGGHRPALAALRFLRRPFSRRWLLAPAAALITLAFFVPALAGPAQASTVLYDLCFVDESYGWAQANYTDGDMSRLGVARTTDGGQTWTIQKSTIAFNGTGTDLAFVNRKRGIWINSYVYLTTDGGRTWSRRKLPRGCGGASYVDFASPGTVWIAGTWGSDGNGRWVARSTNGGRTWQRRLSQPRDLRLSASDLSAPTATTAYLCNIWSNGALWVTRSAGKRWNRVRSSYGFKRAAYWTIDFPTARTGWALRHDTASLVRTRDGGRHWRRQMRGLQQRLTDMDFISARTGWIVGAAGAVYRTRDGGASWTCHKVPTDDKLISVDFCDARHGWVSTDAGWEESNWVYRTTDGGDTWELVW
jgi:photosystem II stability/assembly factor-like uncharacterized protein